MRGAVGKLASGLLAALAAIGSLAAAKEPEPAFVAPKTFDELDARIAEAMKNAKAPGLQVALVDSSGATWAKAYGFIDKEKRRRAENDSVFRAGSISKSFTGVLAQMLVEDGTLDLDERLRDAAPEVQFTNKWDATNPVLLVDLSEHTTGWDDIQFSEYRDFGPDSTSLEGIAFNPKSRTSRWRPGTYVSYDNVGPAILGLVMEKKTGRSFDELMQERIFGPLGMENVSFRLTDEIAAKLSKSYTLNGGVEPYAHIGMRPAGSLNCSASELGKFVALLIRRGEASGAALISPEGVARIESPTRSLAARRGLKMGYGLGVYGQPAGVNGTVYGHNGGIDGFLADYGYFRDAGSGFVMMMNAPDGDLYREVRRNITGYLRTQNPPPPAAPPVTDENLAQYAGYYRQITPRSEFMRLLTDAFDVARVYVKDGALFVAPPFGDGARLVSLGNGQFTDEGGRESDRVIAESDLGEMEMLRGLQDAYRRVSPAEAFMPLAILALAGAGCALTAFTVVLWTLLRPFGLFKRSNRWRVWLWPAFGFIALGAAFGAFVVGASGGFESFVRNLGGPSLLSLTITAATYAAPLTAALGVLAAFVAPRVTAGARILAGFASLTLAAFSVYLWTHGWIGLTIWSYQPQVTGG